MCGCQLFRATHLVLFSPSHRLCTSYISIFENQNSWLLAYWTDCCHVKSGRQPLVQSALLCLTLWVFACFSCFVVVDSYVSICQFFGLSQPLELMSRSGLTYLVHLVLSWCCYLSCWDGLWNHLLSHCLLSVRTLCMQFWFDFDEILFSYLGPKK